MVEYWIVGIYISHLQNQNPLKILLDGQGSTKYLDTWDLRAEAFDRLAYQVTFSRSHSGTRVPSVQISKSCSARQLIIDLFTSSHPVPSRWQRGFPFERDGRCGGTWGWHPRGTRIAVSWAYGCRFYGPCDSRCADKRSLTSPSFLYLLCRLY